MLCSLLGSIILLWCFEYNVASFFCSFDLSLVQFIYALPKVLFFSIVGWLDCPAVGQEIGYIIPSKVPLGEAFNDSVLPGKRYSSRQVIHQQRVLGRKVSMLSSCLTLYPMAIFFHKVAVF